MAGKNGVGPVKIDFGPVKVECFSPSLITYNFIYSNKVQLKQNKNSGFSEEYKENQYKKIKAL